MNEKVMGISNAHIPGSGDNSNLFERLLSYISKVDPDWINRIKPASQESIAQLRKLSGIEDAGWDFPQSYKVFLEHMGGDDGGAFNAIEGYMTIDVIIDLYKETHELQPEALNSQYLSCVLTHFDGQISFDMSQADNPTIVMAYDGEYGYFFSESFEKLLFQYAFRKYESLYHPENIGFGGSQNMVKEAMRRHQITDVFDVVDLC